MSEFISLYSGSSGNCSVVRTGEKYIIIDMGKGVRTTSAALKELGLNISDCAGILVTHEHSDHVKGLATFLKKNPLPVYGADDTLDFLDANGIVPASCELRTLSGGEEDVGDFGVTMFPTSHDVPCVGYRIHTPDNKTMTIATDLGVLTPPVHQALSGCDLVALESNYDLHMLRSGRYPYYLRSRIESNRGHLSNDECSAKLLELMPNAQLIASIAGANYLKNITNRCDLDIHKVKDGEVLDLGGLSLTFLSAPNLHWPDSMFTWVKEANTLFTCDFFGLPLLRAIHL